MFLFVCVEVGICVFLIFIYLGTLNIFEMSAIDVLYGIYHEI